MEGELFLVGPFERKEQPVPRNRRLTAAAVALGLGLVVAAVSPAIANEGDDEPVQLGLLGILGELPKIVGDIENADPGAVPTVVEALVDGFLGADIVGGGDVGEDGSIGGGAGGDEDGLGSELGLLGSLLHIGSLEDLLAGRF